MDSAVFIEVLIIGYLLLTVYLANQVFASETLHGERVRFLLYGAAILIGLLGLYVVFAAMFSAQVATLSPEERAEAQVTDVSEVGFGWVIFALLIVTIAGYAIIMLINSQDTRHWLRERLPKTATYSPASIVHETAVVFVILMITIALTSFAAAGGTQGVAEQLDEGISPSDLLIQAVVQVIVAVLGVGYLIRRDLPQMLERLGLRIPTQEDFTYGFGGGFVLYVGAVVFTGLLTIIFSPEQIAEQSEAAENLASAFLTVPLALLLASSAAIGEEVFFRGAIQPVFGLIPTAAFFTLMHSQVLFTPGMIWIFAVGVVLGWIRQTHSTSAAIFAHFTYNLILLLAQILLQSPGGA